MYAPLSEFLRCLPCCIKTADMDADFGDGDPKSYEKLLDSPLHTIAQYAAEADWDSVLQKA